LIDKLTDRRLIDR